MYLSGSCRSDGEGSRADERRDFQRGYAATSGRKYMQTYHGATLARRGPGPGRGGHVPRYTGPSSRLGAGLGLRGGSVYIVRHSTDRQERLGPFTQGKCLNNRS